MARDEGDPRQKNPNPERVFDRRVPFEVVVEKYPHLKEYLLEHNRAQLQGDMRLMSAAEKIARFGGVEQVRKNLEGRDVGPLVLQACRDGIMAATEIIDFSELVGRRLDAVTVHSVLDKLNDPDEPEKGKIKRVDGITVIYEIPLASPARKYMIAERVGFSTTDEGIRQLASSFERKPSPGWLGSLTRPQGI